MGSRSRDPFNFDDIYRQAGVEDLFVKKSLSEMKKTVSATPSGLRLDTAKVASNGSIPAVSSQHSSPRILNIMEPRPTPPVTASGLSSDPFAGLGLPQSTTSASATIIQQKMSAVAAKTSSPRQAANNADLEFLGPVQSKPSAQKQAVLEFDDIFGTCALAPAPALKSSAPVDPFALFEAIPGASAPVTTPASVPIDRNTPVAPALNPVPQVARLQASSSQVSTSVQQAEDSRHERLHGSSSSKSQHCNSPASSPRAGARTCTAIIQPAPPPPPSYDQAFNAPSASCTEVEQEPLTPRSLARSLSHNSMQAQSSQSSKGSSSFAGVLKILGKTSKTVIKAAKDGLSTLNDALERFDHADKYGAPRAYCHSSKDEDGIEFPAEKALASAIQISEMPPHEQEVFMGQLPRNIRIKVAEILREQAMAEAEGPVSEEPFGQTQQAALQAQSSQTAAPAEPEVLHTHEFKLDDDAPAARSSPACPQHPTAQAPGIGSPPAPPNAAPIHDDLLGISTPPPAPAPAVVMQDDLFGFDTAPVNAAPARTAAAPAVHEVDMVTDFFTGGVLAATPAHNVHHTATPSSDSLDAFFSGGEVKPAAPQPAKVPASRPAAGVRLAAVQPARAAQPVFQDRVGGQLEDHGPARHVPTGPLFQDDIEDLNEPEIRKQLRAQRLAEKERKIQAALDEKLAKEKEEAAHRELQVHLKERYKEGIMAWKNKNKDNVRGLLGSLQTVLWENSGWQPIGMGDLLEPTQVRKAWMKANLIVHPDKVRQKNGTPDQLAIADMVFDVLKEAWGKFQK